MTNHPPNDGQYDVFISYRRRESSSLASLLAETLQANGLRVYLDVRTLVQLGPFGPRLEEAIEDARVFVCLLGETTLNSDWVLREIEQAHRLGKPMLPIFQESFSRRGAPGLPHVQALLANNGLVAFDKRNIYLEEMLTKLVQMVVSQHQLTSSQTVVNFGFTAPRAIIIENEPDFFDALADMMKALGFEVIGASDLQQAYRHIKTTEFDLITLDISLGHGGKNDIGLMLPGLIDAQSPNQHTGVIVISAYAEHQRRAFTEVSVDDYLDKLDLDEDSFRAAVRRTLLVGKLRKSRTCRPRLVFSLDANQRLTEARLENCQGDRVYRPLSVSAPLLNEVEQAGVATSYSLGQAVFAALQAAEPYRQAYSSFSAIPKDQQALLVFRGGAASLRLPLELARDERGYLAHRYPIVREMGSGRAASTFYEQLQQSILVGIPLRVLCIVLDDDHAGEAATIETLLTTYARNYDLHPPQVQTLDAGTPTAHLREHLAQHPYDIIHIAGSPGGRLPLTELSDALGWRGSLLLYISGELPAMADGLPASYVVAHRTAPAPHVATTGTAAFYSRLMHTLSPEESARHARQQMWQARPYIEDITWAGLLLLRR